MASGFGYAFAMLAQRLDNAPERPWRDAWLALPSGRETDRLVLRTVVVAQARLGVLKRRWESGIAAGIEIAAWLAPNRLHWVRPLRWVDGRLEAQVLFPRRRGFVGSDVVWLREDEVVDWVVCYPDHRVEGFFLQQQRRAIRRVTEKRSLADDARQ